MSPLFRFERVGVERDGTRVLVDVDAVVRAAGVTALIGASGSGKSTLLRCCNRLERPSTGRVLYRDADVATLDPLAHRRRVAMVFQAPTVFAGSALTNLRAADPGLSVDAAADLLTRVGLPATVLDQEADTLSGGEAQRLCLARALATEPDAILADEPTSALDAASTRILEALARDLADGGVPVVWVTHDMEQMRRIADDVIALDRGQVRYSGTVAALPLAGDEPT